MKHVTSTNSHHHHHLESLSAELFRSCPTVRPRPAHRHALGGPGDANPGAMSAGRGLAALHGAHQRQAGAPILQPRVRASIPLQQQPRLGHALPTTSMLGGPLLSGTPESRPLPPALPGGPGEVQTFPLLQQLYQMAIVAALIGGLRQGQRLRPQSHRQRWWQGDDHDSHVPPQLRLPDDTPPADARHAAH